MSFKSVEEVLDFAISKEEQSAEFYNDLADRSERPAMKKAFQQFAQEELGHKKKIQEMKAGKTILSDQGPKVMDLKIADYTVDVEPKPTMSYEDSLVVAMKMEKAAFRLYSDLAASTNDPSLQSILQALAQEEAKHKLRFEVEYDTYAQRDN